MDAIDRAARILGSQTALADLCGVSKGAVSQWKEPGRRVPAEYCPLIERATREKGDVVRCEELRPDVAWEVLRSLATKAKRGVSTDGRPVGQLAQQPAAKKAFTRDDDFDPESSIDNSSKG